MIAIRLLHDGHVVREQVFERLPVEIGRAGGDGFSLVDGSVSRRHATLELGEDGTLELRDQDSRNGVWLGHARVARVTVAGRTRCHLGEVELEIERLASDAPTLEVKLSELAPERRRGRLDLLRYLAAGVTGWIALVVLQPSFWSPWNKGLGAQLLGHGLAALVLLPLGAAVLFVLLRAFGRRLRLADTLQAVGRVMWLWPAAALVGYVGYYALPNAWLGWLGLLVSLATSATAVAVLASVRRTPVRRFATAWAIATTLIVGGIVWTSSLAAQRAGQPNPDFHVQAPLLGAIGPAVELDDFLGAVGTLATETAADAERVRLEQDRP